FLRRPLEVAVHPHCHWHQHCRRSHRYRAYSFAEFLRTHILHSLRRPRLSQQWPTHPPTTSALVTALWPLEAQEWLPAAVSLGAVAADRVALRRQYRKNFGPAPWPIQPAAGGLLQI